MSAERAAAGTDDQNTLDGADALTEPLYVVRVRDHVDERIAGQPGCAYTSPPAPRDSALALVCLLLGEAARPANGTGSWTRAVPGGQRAITLAPEAAASPSRHSPGAPPG